MPDPVDYRREALVQLKAIKSEVDLLMMHLGDPKNAAPDNLHGLLFAAGRTARIQEVLNSLYVCVAMLNNNPDNIVEGMAVLCHAKAWSFEAALRAEQKRQEG